jgi:hypothetical protein
MRTFTLAFVTTLLLLPATVAAQNAGFGIGPRFTFVRGSEELPDDERRFTGGAIRLGGGRAAIEVAMDFRSTEVGPLQERVRQYPIQASLLLFPVRARLAPYVLAGVGWYTQNITRFVAPTGEFEATDETTRKMGYHLGLGAEVRLHRHVALFGDLRYTRLGISDDEDGPEQETVPRWIPGAQLLKLSHEGSTFTWGAMIYF